MSTDTTTATDDGIDDEAALANRIEELEEELADLKEEVGGQKKMTIIATKGTLDMAYPPLILASTAAAFGWDVVVFHTFWGLDILHQEKSKNLKLSAVGNPSMPMPNALAALPYMDSMATKMMERKIEENGTATIEELIDVSIETGVELQACQMTMDLMDYDESKLYDGVVSGVGAATALEHMADSDVQLLI
ncbi:MULTISPECIES: DsrE/DsrF/DrsH-like family protein [unclassified Haladaptatus]|uniref:DsrE/DsrF/DrsH-like family protein n=1 Tax=unclassified Haladaptatus TaxID=2622732 RepID=UPI00209C576B|nr:MULTISPECIES: DsrE/DsrF/DrsH-like family protein [unclassified Haladaptatus]MCO8245597.1 DsrE/DsrF/DrsH-like family protein [Haladaptatus sp. AB643]MCO8255425.1 DsrE/DsrF/DrsH-like family protein [Haladaptatus sp. AB618]